MKSSIMGITNIPLLILHCIYLFFATGSASKDDDDVQTTMMMMVVMMLRQRCWTTMAIVMFTQRW